MTDYLDSDCSTPSYLSPNDDDDDFNMSDYDGEEEEEDLVDDKKTKAIKEGFALHPSAENGVNSPNNDKFLSTQPASQSVTKKQRRTSPRSKQKGITGAIAGAITRESESLIIPKKPSPPKKQQAPKTTKPPSQTPMQTKQPPMKKRKVSLSPTDSLAKQRPTTQAIDLLADDDNDDDSDDEILAVKRDRMNNANVTQQRMSPSMLAAASKQQKEHVSKAKEMKKQQKAKKKSDSNASEIASAKNIDEKSNAFQSSKSRTESRANQKLPPAESSSTTKKDKAPKQDYMASEKNKDLVTKSAATESKPKKTKPKKPTAMSAKNDSESSKAADASAKTKDTTAPSKATDSKAKPAAIKVKPPPKKKKKRATFEEELLQKMFMSCRPYAIRDLVQLMGKTTSEASVNFCLLSLIDKKWVIKKEFKSGNRSKELYWANQESKDKKLWALDCLQLPSSETIRETRLELASLQQQQKTLVREIEEIEKTPSNDHLAVLCQNAQTEVDDLAVKLEAMKKRIASGPQQNKAKKPGLGFRNNRFGSNKMPPKKAQTPLQLKKRINAMRDHWVKRRRKCMDFVEALADGMEKKVKDVVNKVLELETDEEAKAVLPPKHAV